MFRFFIVAALIVGAMIVIKQESLLQRAGLLGSCDAVAPPSGQDGDWHACKDGKLSGAQDLSLKSCTKAGYVGVVAYWRCPAPIDANIVRQ
ncbi:MAG: hypothetical protein M3540_12250 [Actinomycetota bacterium]|nr:hypothetical protein [Actinomycetota bacterium]